MNGVNALVRREKRHELRSEKLRGMCSTVFGAEKNARRSKNYTPNLDKWALPLQGLSAIKPTQPWKDVQNAMEISAWYFLEKRPAYEPNKTCSAHMPFRLICRNRRSSFCAPFWQRVLVSRAFFLQARVFLYAL